MAIIAGISGFAGLLILLFGVSRIRLVSLVIKCFSPCDKVKTTMSLILNKETTTFSLQDMFRHSYVIFSCKCDFNGCTFEFI